MKKTKILLMSIGCLVISSTSCYQTGMLGGNGQYGGPNDTMKGAGVGAAVGAVAGAVVGKQSNKPVTGAAIGAIAGGVLGGYQGKKTQEQKDINRQQEERIRQLEERAVNGY